MSNFIDKILQGYPKYTEIWIPGGPNIDDSGAMIVIDEISSITDIGKDHCKINMKNGQVITVKWKSRQIFEAIYKIKEKGEENAE